MRLFFRLLLSLCAVGIVHAQDSVLVSGTGETSSAGRTVVLPAITVEYNIGGVVVGSGAAGTDSVHQGMPLPIEDRPVHASDQIPSPQYVVIGTTLRLDVRPPNALPKGYLTLEYPENTPGTLPALSPARGADSVRTFTYTPAARDNESFVVRFKATEPGKPSVDRDVTIIPRAPLENVSGRDWGMLAGDFSVGENGGFTYKLDVEVPQGVAGMQPTLSLSYSSTGEDGIMGPGWTMGGLSVVSRQGFRKNFNGSASTPVEFASGSSGTIADMLTIDGQPLMSVTGNDYGSNGARYMTERANFTLVTQNGQGSNISFEAVTKSGLTLEYGGTGDSKVRTKSDGTSSVEAFWAVNKVSDRNGNHFRIEYDPSSTTLEFLPRRISYPYNNGGPNEPLYEILFEYETRPDLRTLYLSGQVVTLSRRLKAIAIQTTNANPSPNQQIRRYDITYDDQGVYGKVVAITESGRNGVVKEPVLFDWSDNAPFSIARGPQSPLTKEDFQNVEGGNLQVSIEDLDGNGLPDILAYDLSRGTNVGYYNRGNMRFDRRPSVLPSTEVLNKKAIVFGDFNRDLRRDILVWDNVANGRSVIYRNAGDSGFVRMTVSGLNLVGSRLIATDLNADGADDLFWMDSSNGSNIIRFNTIASTGVVQFGTEDINLVPSTEIGGSRIMSMVDWNGDGNADVLSYDKATGQSSWIRSYGGAIRNGRRFETTAQNKIRTDDIKGGAGLFFGDWNADGLNDIVWFDYRTGANRWYLNTGDLRFATLPGSGAFQDIILPPSLVASDSGYVTPIDLNADRYSDLIWSNWITGETKLFMNRGVNDRNATFTQVSSYGDVLNEKKGSGYIPADWLGSSATGFFWYDRETGEHRFYLNNTKNRVLVNSVREGNGNTIDVRYSTLLDTAVYRPGSPSKTPLAEATMPLVVVREYSRTNNAGNRNRYAMAYRGAKIDMEGFGYRGFETVTMSDLQTGLQTTETYKRDSAQQYGAGMLVRKVTRIAATGQTLDSASYVPAYVTPRSSVTYFAYTAGEHTSRFDPDSPGKRLSAQDVASQYDVWGNVLRRTTTFKDGALQVLQTETVDNVYGDANRPEYQQFGRLTSSRVTRSASGTSSVSRRSLFAYNDANLQLETETVLATNGNIVRSRWYGYDRFGNTVRTVDTAYEYLENRRLDSTRESVTQYDDYGLFPVRSTNVYGHQQITEHDYLHQMPRKTTSPNGLVTLAEYDDLGRLARSTDPLGNVTSYFYKWGVPDELRPGEMFKSVIAQADGAVVTQYHDFIGRVLRTEQSGFGGVKTVSEAIYDTLGRLVRESKIRYAGESPKYTLLEYDRFGRPTKETLPGGRVTAMAYAGLQIARTNPLQQTETKRTDALGNLTEVEDANGQKNRYTYDLYGKLLSITDPLGNSVRYSYDVNGSLGAVSDPSHGGSWSMYNGFGEKYWEQDTAGRVFAYRYDRLGRMVSMTQQEGNTRFYYDGQKRGLVDSIAGYNGHRLANVYDGFDRIVATHERIPARRAVDSNDVVPTRSYSTGMGYDQYGRVRNLVYPDAKEISHKYDNHGFLTEVTAGGNSVYRVENVSATGNVLRATYGNGVVADATYDDNTDNVTQLRASSSGQGTLLNRQYAFDNVGNLVRRQDATRNLTETFAYDRINRLTSARVEGQNEVTVTYDAAGNITRKSDVGTYRYGENGAGPYAVTSIDGIDLEKYTRTTGFLTEVAFTSFRKVSVLDSDSSRLELAYGVSQQRVRAEMWKNKALDHVKFYIGNHYEETLTDTARPELATRLSYIRYNGNVVATLTSTATGEQRQYWHRDHLGSLELVTDQAGNVVTELSYDPWGNRRDPKTWRPFDSTYRPAIARGFTTHEHYDLLGLIDMNGRVYDPRIARFISPDPFIDGLYSTQGMNRYSYVHNNPLSYTDPSGYGGFKSTFNKVIGTVRDVAKVFVPGYAHFDALVEHTKAGREIKEVVQKHEKEIIIVGVAVGVSVATGGAASYLVGTWAGAGLFAGAVAGGAVGGFSSTFVTAKMSGASTDQAMRMGFKSAAIGGVTAGLTYGVGELGGLVDQGAGHGTSMQNVWIKAPLHGVIQGGAAEAQGSSFRSGFLAGSFTGFASLGTGHIQDNGLKIISAGIVGGTASEIGGGKFSNGAVSGAMQTVYNDLAGDLRSAQRDRDPLRRLYGSAKASWGLAGYADGTALVDQAADLWLKNTGDYAGYVTIKMHGMILTGATLPVKVVVAMAINPVVVLYNEMKYNEHYRGTTPIPTPTSR